MYDLEFTEVNKGQAFYIEDVKFLNIAKNGIRQKDGHYELSLPFKDAEHELPNNRMTALK